MQPDGPYSSGYRHWAYLSNVAAADSRSSTAPREHYLRPIGVMLPAWARVPQKHYRLRESSLCSSRPKDMEIARCAIPTNSAFPNGTANARKSILGIRRATWCELSFIRANIKASMWDVCSHERPDHLISTRAQAKHKASPTSLVLPFIKMMAIVTPRKESGMPPLHE